MNCMKCGREFQEQGVFCRDCLEEMEKYPVLPGTVVQLPRHREQIPFRRTLKRHVPSAEEQLAKLRKTVAILLLLLMICVGLIVLMFNPTMHYIGHDHFAIGQNYSSVTSNQTTPTFAE